MSKVIQFLRLPLMVTIVMIHAYIKEYDISNPEIPYSFMGAVQYFFSNIVSQVAIPMFFCFSGYLFFLPKCKGWTDRRIGISSKVVFILCLFLMSFGICCMCSSIM